MLTPPPTGLDPVDDPADAPAFTPPDSTGKTIYRELEAEEFHRLDGHPAFGGIRLDPAECVVVIAERDGEIIGTQGAFNLIHLEGAWVHPDHRQRPRVALRVLEKTREILDQHRVPVAFCWAATPEVSSYLERVGMTRLPVDSFAFVIDPAATETPCPPPSPSPSSSLPPVAVPPSTLPTAKPAASKTR